MERKGRLEPWIVKKPTKIDEATVIKNVCLLVTSEAQTLVTS